MPDVFTAFDHGENSDVDTSAEVLTSTSFACRFGVLLKAAAGNGDTVYVGKSDVTAGGTDATDGYPLAAGEELFLPVSDPADIYVIGGAVDQAISYIAI